MKTKLKLIIFLIIIILFGRHGFAQDGVWVQNGTNIHTVSTNSVGIGTVNPDTKLTVNGKIHTNEVLVDANIPVPDFVFNKDYHLLSLNDLEKYIKKENHLPGIPSADTIKQNGITLSEMTLNILRKTEELTLYIINHDDRINDLKRKIELGNKNKFKTN
jgi:hypothetical protein